MKTRVSLKYFVTDCRKKFHRNIFGNKVFLRSSVVTERFIRTLKNKIYKCMTSISENIYIKKLDDIVNKYNNIYHRIIKRNPVDVKPRLYIDFNKENNQKEFRVEKVIKKKGDKLYAKWKGYNNSFNSWIDKKDIVI